MRSFFPGCVRLVGKTFQTDEAMRKKTDIVWWSDTGKVLHHDPDCPPFLRARRDAIAAIDRGDYERGVGIRSYDFNEQGSEGNAVYPPEWMMLCEKCG